jgi:hypothetical protein
MTPAELAIRKAALREAYQLAAAEARSAGAVGANRVRNRIAALIDGDAAAADYSLLVALARDVTIDMDCVCYVDDLPDGEPCPCGGDGRDEKGNPGDYEGCWKCQARSALAVAGMAP